MVRSNWPDENQFLFAHTTLHRWFLPHCSSSSWVSYICGSACRVNFIFGLMRALKSASSAGPRRQDVDSSSSQGNSSVSRTSTPLQSSSNARLRDGKNQFFGGWSRTKNQKGILALGGKREKPEVFWFKPKNQMLVLQDNQLLVQANQLLVQANQVLLQEGNRVPFLVKCWVLNELKKKFLL